MNAAFKNIVSALNTGGAQLGDLCWWSLADATISRADLETKWKATGLPMELLPEPTTTQAAFKRAIRETQVGLVDRLLRLAVDDEASVIFAVVHESKHDDGTLVYDQEAKVVQEEDK